MACYLRSPCWKILTDIFAEKCDPVNHIKSENVLRVESIDSFHFTASYSSCDLVSSATRILILQGSGLWLRATPEGFQSRCNAFCCGIFGDVLDALVAKHKSKKLII